MRDLLRKEQARAAVNAAILTSFAVTQPLLDLLARAPDFLVAHRTSPEGILALTATVSVVLPMCAALLAWLAFRAHALAGRIVMLVMVALTVSLMAVLVLRESVTSGRAVIAAAGVIGLAAAIAYARRAALRTFVTWLAPGLVVFPVLFLANAGIRTLVWPHASTAGSAAAGETPVVMVVFDQFPLTSLLDEQHGIDAAVYPAFASLAAESTWYRNATSVSGYTRWALPAILTGQRPRPAVLPVAAHHPGNIFTLLGASHRMHVFEPITAICPREICDQDQQPLAVWARGLARALSTAYLHAVVPSDLAGSLPSVDQGWHEPPTDEPGDSIGEQWFERHRRGRRREVFEFLDAIGRTESARPEFHFLHVLLPHEPFIYFPDGERYSTETRLPGLMGREMWRNDDWAATQAYRGHLLQAAYVDRLLGRLVARLKETGLYDRALIVITSDHGASFREGKAFRRLTPETRMDILPVPLFMKQPHQTHGIVDDRNVESIDIVPTIADILDVELQWTAEGNSALAHGSGRSEKRAFLDDATRSVGLPASLLDEAFGAARRKHALFGDTSANRFYVPLTSPARELIGQGIEALRIVDGADQRFTLGVRGDFDRVTPGTERLPANLAGTAGDGSGQVILAIALNGVVRVTTRTYPFDDRGVRGAWTAVIPADAFQRGRNVLEIFAVSQDSAGPLLRHVYRSDDDRLDLSAPAAVYAWGVQQEGFHDREWRDGIPYRWTEGVARLTVPITAGMTTKALGVTLMMSGRNKKPLRVTVNGCEVFRGALPAGKWARTFDLSACPDIQGQAVIELITDVDRSRNRMDRRRLGIAVERIDLLDTPSVR